MAEQRAWVLITGSTSPLGSAIASAVAAAGYNVALHYCRQSDEVARIAAQCRTLGSEVYPCQGDFSSITGVQLFLECYLASGIATAHLINNASVYTAASLLHISPDDWQALWQLNLTAPWLLMQGLSAQIIPARGSIINIGAAGSTRILANMYNPAYMMTKEALWRATCSLAKELASHRVRVNMVAPGHLSHSVDLALFSASLPTKEPISLQAVVEVVLFLLSPQASAVTGQNIEVSAGSLL
jgi:NAD(P)-dependent dehydrogenase (short-subunit alcohol dehydrogenase family)